VNGERSDATIKTLIGGKRANGGGDKLKRPSVVEILRKTERGYHRQRGTKGKRQLWGKGKKN